MEQQTGSKLGKEYIKAVYCHPAYLTYMQSTACEMLGWMKHKLESRLPGEISITSGMQMSLPLWKEVKRNWRASWGRWKSEKSSLKLNIQKAKIMASGPITLWQIDGKTMEIVTDFIFLASKILLPGKKFMTNLESILKSRNFANKVLSSQSYGFSSSHVWIWELDHQEDWAPKNWCFEPWCRRRLLKVPWTTRKSNQLILKEITPAYTLEGLTLKLKLQYFGHLMWRASSL